MFIPLNTILEVHSSAKNIQGAPNGQINSTLAELLYPVKIPKSFSSSSISYW